MDDFVITNLHEARNEWCSRLVSILTGHVIEGIQSIFNESWKMCVDNGEINKYLMTFQNLISSIPKWNGTIIDEERKRIVERSGCNHLEELITCVHIIQLKILTSIRVGNKQKKIDISIPNVNAFIHKVYIHVARKVYSNVYLFEKNVTPLVSQRNHRELELLVQECILISIRESIPTEDIIRAYLDESVEEEQEVIIEPLKEESSTSGATTGGGGGAATSVEAKDSVAANAVGVKEEEPPAVFPSVKDLNDEPVITRLTFNDYDSTIDVDKNESVIHAPKDLDRLEEISISRLMQQKLENSQNDNEEEAEKIKIMEPMSLDIFDLEKTLTDDVPLLDVIDL